jgi:hypothetical protein
MDASGSPVEAAAPVRPQPAKSMSFSRFDAPRSQPQTRSRASTLQGAIPEIMLQPSNFSSSPEGERHDGPGDPFSSREDDEHEDGNVADVAGLPQRLEDLPIEIRSLTER